MATAATLMAHSDANTSMTGSKMPSPSESKSSPNGISIKTNINTDIDSANIETKGSFDGESGEALSSPSKSPSNQKEDNYGNESSLGVEAGAAQPTSGNCDRTKLGAAQTTALAKAAPTPVPKKSSSPSQRSASASLVTSMMPPDLRRVLLEVSRTGAIPRSLPWDGLAEEDEDILAFGSPSSIVAGSAYSFSRRNGITVETKTSTDVLSRKSLSRRDIFLRTKNRERASATAGAMLGFLPLSSSSPAKKRRSSYRYPSRKKRRNGFNTGVASSSSGGGNSRRKIGSAQTSDLLKHQQQNPMPSTTTTTTTTTMQKGSRKRALPSFSSSDLGPSNASSATSNNPVTSPSMVLKSLGASSQSSAGGGRTSGSEMSQDESTYYECDSEGTSATTNSELSSAVVITRKKKRLGTEDEVGRGGTGRRGIAGFGFGATTQLSSRALARTGPPPLPYRTLRGAIRFAMALVLDYAYKHCGGYKLNSIERRKLERRSSLGVRPLAKLDSNDNDDGDSSVSSSHRYSSSWSTLTPSAVSSSGSPTSPGGKSRIIRPSSSLAETSLSETAFLNRRASLLAMLGSDSRTQATSQRRHGADGIDDVNPGDASSGRSRMKSPSYYSDSSEEPRTTGPPFTIQRIAEVLVSPERYYSQTHKLCNALEKLLLVKSPSSMLINVPGDSQGSGKPAEIAAGIKEKSEELTEGVQKRRKRRVLLSSDETEEASRSNRNYDDRSQVGDDSQITTPFPASEPNVLASKPAPQADSVGRKPQPNLTDSNRDSISTFGYTTENQGKSLVLLGRNVNTPLHAENLNQSAIHRTPAAQTSFLQRKGEGESLGALPAASFLQLESTGGTTAPPPGEVSLVQNSLSLNSLSTPRSNDANSSVGGSHFASAGIDDPVVQQQQHHHRPIARPPSPILFTPTVSTAMVPHVNAHQATQVLRAHHAAALSGPPVLGASPAVQLEILIHPPTAPGQAPNATEAPTADVADLDADQGRSSASNSDVDSESGDDISLDDSASDRSDGSDSGPTTMTATANATAVTAYYEPFTAARVMALNRIYQQQQQRREQYLQSRALASVGPNFSQVDGYRPPPDADYQSGDSIDSLVAEDSGGSDSSSSDLAD